MSTIFFNSLYSKCSRKTIFISSNLSKNQNLRWSCVMFDTNSFWNIKIESLKIESALYELMKQTLFCNVVIFNEFNAKHEKNITKRVSDNVEKICIFLFANSILKNIKLFEIHVLKLFFLRSQKILLHLKTRNICRKKENHDFFEKVQRNVEINNQTNMKIQCINATTWFTKQIEQKICMKMK